VRLIRPADVAAGYCCFGRLAGCERDDWISFPYRSAHYRRDAMGVRFRDARPTCSDLRPPLERASG
jgi:hypothetical protein